MPPVDQAALADAQAATAVLVRQGKVAEPVGAMVIPAQRGGVLFAVGGRDGELYVNGRALTQDWADHLRIMVRELASDIIRLQTVRAGVAGRSARGPHAGAGRRLHRPELSHPALTCPDPGLGSSVHPYGRRTPDAPRQAIGSEPWQT